MIDYFGHLHRPCLIAEKLQPSGYPNGSLHRKVLEQKLGRSLLYGHETHHVCENRGCIEPTHLEEKEMVKHRGDHARAQKGIPHGPMNLDGAEIERRQKHGKEMIHHALIAQSKMSSDEISIMKSRAASFREVLTVRDDELLCTNCCEWKSDEKFGVDRNRKVRRCRRYVCKTCRKSEYESRKGVLCR